MTQLLTANEAAKALAVTPYTLWQWAKAVPPKIPFVKLGRNIRFKESDVEEFIARRTVKAVSRKL